MARRAHTHAHHTRTVTGTRYAVRTVLVGETSWRETCPRELSGEPVDSERIDRLSGDCRDLSGDWSDWGETKKHYTSFVLPTIQLGYVSSAW